MLSSTFLGLISAIYVATIYPGHAKAEISGSNSITPHDYVGLGSGLENNPPWCGMSYNTLDIGRITAVQGLGNKADCGSCLRIVTDAANCGAIPPIPFKEDGNIDEAKFQAEKENYQKNQVKAIAEGRSETDGMGSEQEGCKGGNGSKRWIYVMAVDQGGQGLDVSRVSFSALFQQPSNPTAATWETVDKAFCEGIELGEGGEGIKNYSKVSDIKVHTGDDPSADTPGSS
ncbi:hypothetical protein H4219_004093 [Mycoemilia scoparia]|uniref:Uncharacterized protein n=1 Tax=Mycoemilia scoparia TaxID=417184 RepID=A0A9W7ZST7_9FUNG|nr:hypothetical protein H4219_004093 [Mycoemilia scoparia]